MKINEIIATYIIDHQKDKPMIIAFDGVDTSGKTTMANNVCRILKDNNKNAVRISIDKFHNPKEIRLQKGELSPEGYFYDSFNLNKIFEYIINPIRINGEYIIKGIYDYKVEKEVTPEKIKIENDLIILFDGIFMNRDELYNVWDISIFLDINFKTVLKRAVIRDIEYFKTIKNLNEKYKKRYIPGEKIYLRLCKPKERATIVINNNDYNKPKIIKGLCAFGLDFTCM
jgi:uridine kinase